MGDRVAIVAIAKNEEKYIVEWLAYHLAVCADEILVFCNDSTDEMVDILSKISASDERVRFLDWPSQSGKSPQRSAYRHALKMVDSDWISFIDIDEFIVPFGFENLKSWVRTLPHEVSAVAINWKGFGSSGVADEDYEFVTRTFRKCSREKWGNNLHFKTVARREKVQSVLIHQAAPCEGRYVLSDMEDLELRDIGSSTRVVHDGIQINHYQSKTWSEFERRMLRGNANFPEGHPRHDRSDRLSRFKDLDKNEEEDFRIRKFDPLLDQEYEKLRDILNGTG